MADISQIKLGTTTYNIKDSTARTNASTAQTSANTSLTMLNGFDNTEGSVKNYIDSQTGVINSFEIILLAANEDLPAASANTINKIYVKAETTGESGNDYAEYVTVDKGASANPRYVWEVFGQNRTGLGLKALAYKDSVSGSLTNYVSGITGASYQPAGSVGLTTASTAITSTGDYQPAGSVSVSLSQTNTAITSTGSYQPAGSISVVLKQTDTTITSTGTYEPEGSITVTSSTATTPTFQVTGSVTSSTITVSPSTASFLSSVKSAGTKPALTTAAQTVATNGVTASVNGEVLTFANASTASVNQVTSWNAGAMPTFNSANAMTGATATASVPTFTGGKFDVAFDGTSKQVSVSGKYSKATISGTPSFTGTTATVSVSGNYSKAGVQSASFTGTTATISVSGNYVKVNSASFTGTTATITPTLTSSTKTFSAS